VPPSPLGETCTRVVGSLATLVGRLEPGVWASASGDDCVCRETSAFPGGRSAAVVWWAEVSGQTGIRTPTAGLPRHVKDGVVSGWSNTIPACAVLWRDAQICSVVAGLAERSTLIGGVVDIEVRLKASRCDGKTARHSEQLKCEAWRFSDCHFHVMTQ
jgi:hypothetical protein